MDLPKKLRHPHYTAHNSVYNLT